MKGSQPLILLFPVYFISGLSALILETLWFRQAGLAFGNSVWASSLVLSSFMAGLAAGSAFVTRFGGRFRNPIRAYAVAEGAVALTGAGLVYLLPVLGATLAPHLSPLLDHPWLLNPIRLVMAFSLLVIPCTAMGVTLPFLAAALTRDRRSFGPVLGGLYGCNTLGAVVGAVLGETWLVGAWGVRGTALVAAFLSGLCLLALETVWFRFLILFVSGHAEVFAWMLAVVLAGVALGGLAASRWLRLYPEAHRYASPVAFATGIFCFVCYATFPIALRPYLTFGTHRSAREIFHLSAPLMLPVACLSGLLYTMIGAALRRRATSETETAGILTLANTIGAALGPLLGVFVLLPKFGMEKSFFIIATLYGVTGTLLLDKRTPQKMAWAGAATFVLSALFFPFGSMQERFFRVPMARLFGPNSDSRVAAVREGPTETIIHVQPRMMDRPLYDVMFTDYHPMSSTNYQIRRYQKLYVYWALAVHPALKRALLICYGVGNTAKALTDSKTLETIDVVDFSRDILETSGIVFPNASDNPLNDPRIRIHIEDGRYFLRATPERYDLITAEPPPPTMAGVVNLYSREYFQLIHDRLAEGGIATYWLPIRELSDQGTKAILRAFCDAFEDCSLWNGTGSELMMVGTRSAAGPVSEKQFGRQWNEPKVAAEMKRLGLERPEQLGALFIGDSSFLRWISGDSLPVVDDHPKRIEAPFGSRQEVDRLMTAFTDVAAARARFQASSLIRGLWPERLRTASRPYFEFQALINEYFYNRTPAERPPDMESVHRLLTASPLTAPVLWELGSNADIQRILSVATPLERTDPALQYQLGVRLLSERNYAQAVRPLNLAEQSADAVLQKNALRLHIYALCMARQTPEAARLAGKYWALGRSKSSLAAPPPKMPGFLLWLTRTFGLVVPRPDQ